MLHQEGGAAVGCLQGIDLLCKQIPFLLSGLVLHQCLVDLCACLQQRLLEVGLASSCFALAIFS